MVSYIKHTKKMKSSSTNQFSYLSKKHVKQPRESRMKKSDKLQMIRMNKKEKDLLVSGDAIVDTMTGGPVRRLSFWLTARALWPWPGAPIGTRALSPAGPPPLRIS